VCAEVGGYDGELESFKSRLVRRKRFPNLLHSRPLARVFPEVHHAAPSMRQHEENEQNPECCVRNWSNSKEVDRRHLLHMIGQEMDCAISAVRTISAVDLNLELPYTLQWNVSVEQGLGQNQSLTASYVASAGYRLLRSDQLFNFNTNFTAISVVRNASSSNYQSLQVQFNRRLSHGLQTLESCTYSHSIDNASDGHAVLSALLTGANLSNPNIDKDNSDFDLRHTFRGALTYNIPCGAQKFHPTPI
jgi:hypothetical protein